MKTKTNTKTSKSSKKEKERERKALAEQHERLTDFLDILRCIKYRYVALTGSAYKDYKMLESIGDTIVKQYAEEYKITLYYLPLTWFEILEQVTLEQIRRTDADLVELSR